MRSDDKTPPARDDKTPPARGDDEDVVLPTVSLFFFSVVARGVLPGIFLATSGGARTGVLIYHDRDNRVSRRSFLVSALPEVASKKKGGNFLFFVASSYHMPDPLSPRPTGVRDSTVKKAPSTTTRRHRRAATTRTSSYLR